MIKSIPVFIKKKFATFCAVLLVPSTGIWFTYWERDQSHRQHVRALLEAESKKHESFIDEVSTHLISGHFNYLETWDNLDRVGFKSLIEFEANRLNQPVPNLQKLTKDSDDVLKVKEYPNELLSKIFGAKLNLLLESLRDVDPITEQQGRSKKLARETLHFLRRTDLLGYGGFFNIDADLSDLDLGEILIPCTSLFGLRVNGANFRQADLTAAFLKPSGDFLDVDFTGSSLSHSWLGGSRIIGSNFNSANMKMIHLKESTMQNSTFENSNMREANMYGVIILDGNVFRKADMRGAVLLFNKEMSIGGRIFDGAFGNSRSVSLKDGSTIPPTVLPSGYTFGDLGLIDLSDESVDSLPGISLQDGLDEPSFAFTGNKSCGWKVAGGLALIDVYRGLSDYSPS
jgi:hypothetical protein